MSVNLIAYIVDDERSGNVDARFERYGEWDVVEHAEPWRQERHRSFRDGPRTYQRNKLCSSPLCHQSKKRRIAAAETAHTTKESNVDAFIHQQMARRCDSLLELKGRK